MFSKMSGMVVIATVGVGDHQQRAENRATERRGSATTKSQRYPTHTKYNLKRKTRTIQKPVLKSHINAQQLHDRLEREDLEGADERFADKGFPAAQIENHKIGQLCSHTMTVRRYKKEDQEEEIRREEKKRDTHSNLPPF